MNRCLAAFTKPEGSLPPYINASVTPEGAVRVLVRGAGYEGGRMTASQSGPEAHMDMTPDAFRAWLREALAALGG